jgi:hypothetical protein
MNARYGRETSTLFYTHLSARQAPHCTVAIPPAGEAAYVFDDLPYHEADLNITMHAEFARDKRLVCLGVLRQLILWLIVLWLIVLWLVFLWQTVQRQAVQQ